MFKTENSHQNEARCRHFNVFIATFQHIKNINPLNASVALI